MTNHEKIPEQEARDMLERMDINNAQAFTAGELVELANLIANARAIVDAYTIEGSNPSYHREQQERLVKEWPTLHRALRRLVEASRIDANA